MAQDFEDGYLDGVCCFMPQRNRPGYIQGYLEGRTHAFCTHGKKGIRYACPYPKPNDYAQT